MSRFENLATQKYSFNLIDRYLTLAASENSSKCLLLYGTAYSNIKFINNLNKFFNIYNLEPCPKKIEWTIEWKILARAIRVTTKSQGSAGSA